MEDELLQITVDSFEVPRITVVRELQEIRELLWTYDDVVRSSRQGIVAEARGRISTLGRLLEGKE